MNRSLRLTVPAAFLLAMGILGGWWLAAPAPAGEPPHIVPVEIHPRWEYKLLAYHPILENMEKELDKLGLEGWEVTGVSNGAVQQVILKRPRR